MRANSTASPAAATEAPSDSTKRTPWFRGDDLACEKPELAFDLLANGIDSYGQRT